MFIVDNTTDVIRYTSASSIQLNSRLDAGIYSYVQDGMGGEFFEKVEYVSDKYIPLTAPYIYEIQEEVDDFVGQIYNKNANLVNKRGVMLAGPAGTGKTAFVNHLITQLIQDHDFVVLRQQSPYNLEDAISRVREKDPNRPIAVVWDEFDQIVYGDEHQVLRVLDGQNSSDNVLIFAMLNDINRLNDRIINRPSRFSLIVKFRNPSKRDIKNYIQHIYESADDETMSTLADLVHGRSFDFAKEVAHLYFNRGFSLEKIARRLQDFENIRDDSYNPYGDALENPPKRDEYVAPNRQRPSAKRSSDALAIKSIVTSMTSGTPLNLQE